MALAAYREELEAGSNSKGNSERTRGSEYDLLKQESRVES